MEKIGKNTWVVVGILVVVVLAAILMKGKTLNQNQAKSPMRGAEVISSEQTPVKNPAPATEQKNVNAHSTLSFDPAASAVSVGQTFSLTAKVDPGSNHVSGAELHITFDPKKVTLEKFVPSDKFSLILQSPQIDNTKGEASVAFGTPLADASVTAISDMAMLSFRALEATPNTSIEFTTASMLSADNETGSVLETSTAASVVVK